MTTTATADASRPRPCPTCGTSFVPHPRKPSQIYCSERCRTTAWRRRRTRNPVTPSTATRNDDTNDTNDTRNAAANQVTAIQRCPHCRQPIILVTLITTPAAARVAVPEPPATTSTSGRYQPRASASATAAARGAIQ